jgi:hypothetical protein
MMIPMSENAQPPKGPEKQQGKGGALAAVILLVVIVGGGVGALMAFSDKEGEVCEGSAWGCARGLLCVDEGDTKRCRKKCEEDSDCDEGGRCRSLIVIGSDEDYKVCSK